MPRPQPLVALHGAVDFSRFIPFDADPLAPALQVNDLLVMRRAAGGPNVLVTVGDIQTHTGSVNIADLLGGTDSELLVRVAGVWTSTPAVRFDGAELSIDGQITTRIAGGGELRNVAASGTIPTLVPRNDRPANGWGGSSGADQMALALDNDNILNWTHTGAADNSVKHTFRVATKTASTTQTQGSGTLNGNLYTDVNVVANPNDTVTLPAIGAAGLILNIMNSGANVLQVFPASGDNFAGEATDASITIAVDESIIIYAISATEWAFLARPATAATVFPEFQFFADQMQNPVTADFAVNALAPAQADSINSGVTNRAFDDTTEEGIAFILQVPSGAANIVLEFKSRAQIAPAAVRTVGLNLYNRGLPDNTGIEAWSAGTQLTDISIPNNNLYQDDSQTITLASLGITAGEITQFELTRINPTAGTELVGDWDLLLVKVSFT